MDSLSLFILLIAVSIAFVCYVYISMNQRMKIARTEESLKTQLSIIEGISSDYLDIVRIDFQRQKSFPLKVNGKMVGYDAFLDTAGRDYDSTWEYYIDKYVLLPDKEKVRKAVAVDTVLKQLEETNEYVCVYRVVADGKIINFKVIFIKTIDSRTGEVYYIEAFRIIDDILEQQRQLDELEEAANRDAMTDFYSRRKYEEDMAELLQTTGIEKNFVFISFDINGLKNVNDEKGHVAGDELIVGAAECAKKSFGAHGKFYRIGGDEFVGLIFADRNHFEALKEDFDRNVALWRGEYSENLYVAIGYASRAEFSTSDPYELSEIADKRMYENKEEFYLHQGVDRRERLLAFEIIKNSYTKILKINLTNDSFSVIQNDTKTYYDEDGHVMALSDWFKAAVTNGEIYEEDIELFRKKVNLVFLKEYFREGNTVFVMQYRRKVEDSYKRVLLEVIPSHNYSHEKQSAYLFVKSID